MSITTKNYISVEEFKALEEELNDLKNRFNSLINNLRPLRSIHWENEKGLCWRLYHTDANVIQEHLSEFGFTDNGHIGYILEKIPE